MNCEQFVVHEFQKECASCHRGKEEHGFDPQVITKIRLALDLDTPTSESRNYLWTPKRCPASKITDFFQLASPKNFPIAGENGEIYRQRQWLKQIPNGDLGPEFCRFIGEENLRKCEEFIYRRNEEHVDEAIVLVLSENLPKECAKCQRVVEFGELMVISPKAGLDCAWHPQCFICTTCGEMPVDLIHCIGDDNNVYCIRHFDEDYKPRCEACDELIFCHEHSNADVKSFHVEHFCCFECERRLSGTPFFVKYNKIYCKACFEDKYRHVCKNCSQRINADQPEYSCRDDHYHEYCFLCADCAKSLADIPFARHDGGMFCGECFTKRFAEVCQTCDERIKAELTSIEYKGNHFHKECFICESCHKRIVEKTFVPRENKNYCLQCYRNLFAMKCDSCQEPIGDRGVTFRKKHFHKNCFKCENCHTPMYDKVMTNDEKYYCENCYSEFFAKQCANCEKPILGKSKYLAYERMYWHVECFRCKTCNKSLASKNFLPINNEIYCESCGDEIEDHKLMETTGG